MKKLRLTANLKSDPPINLLNLEWDASKRSRLERLLAERAGDASVMPRRDLRGAMRLLRILRTTGIVSLSLETVTEKRKR
jgi:hypothetical protein